MSLVIFIDSNMKKILCKINIYFQTHKENVIIQRMVKKSNDMLQEEARSP